MEINVESNRWQTRICVPRLLLLRGALKMSLIIEMTLGLNSCCRIDVPRYEELLKGGDQRVGFVVLWEVGSGLWHRIQPQIRAIELILY